MTSPAKAPRLQAYLERIDGRSAFVAPRAKWELLNVNSTQIVQIDVGLTPMHSMAHDAAVVCTVAHRCIASNARFRSIGMTLPILLRRLMLTTILSGAIWDRILGFTKS